MKTVQGQRSDDSETFCRSVVREGLFVVEVGKGEDDCGRRGGVVVVVIVAAAAVVLFVIFVFVFALNAVEAEDDSVEVFVAGEHQSPVPAAGELGSLEQADALVVEPALEGLFCFFGGVGGVFLVLKKRGGDEVERKGNKKKGLWA